MFSQESCTRRQLLGKGAGLIGLSLAELLGLRRQARVAAAPARGNGFGRARSCIVFFSWGGMSHIDTWDPKPDAPAEVRGDYGSIATAVPEIRLGEYMTLLAPMTSRLAIVRSVTHSEIDHSMAAYWNLTGHQNISNGMIVPRSRNDWPSVGAAVSRFRPARRGFPGSVAMPYPMLSLSGGQDGGFLGPRFDPLVMNANSGKPYDGVHPTSGLANLRLSAELDASRLQSRLELLRQFDVPGGRTLTNSPAATSLDSYREMAADLLLSPQVSTAFDLEREPSRLRATYGDHVCGQSALLARRLTEAGVPLVTICAAAADLNGGLGDVWDTHADIFKRLKTRLLPPFEQASAALLNDLAERGRLEETLVVWLTEFGRTPRLNDTAGRHHHPRCYSVAFAGGGIRGGQVYGRSDRNGVFPAERACGPKDLHATILHALGIPLDSQVQDALGRPHALTEGQPLPLFG